ncbi:MAG TPA: hypothetical protein LFV90_07025 [Rickettsia endosymbiont of Columbicola hoogstraali]|nr:hypothetical protein [Rickettsia endosymbiont of Columbicola hoogstraali]
MSTGSSIKRDKIELLILTCCIYAFFLDLVPKPRDDTPMHKSENDI